MLCVRAIKWGTDPQPEVLYGQVGGVDSDHKCWQRPEGMTTQRTVFKIDDQHPETAAALAAASIALSHFDKNYSSQLLTHAKQVSW